MVNTLDQPLLDRMIDSGLYQITLSVDSGSAITLRNEHRKPVNLSRLPGLMAYLKSRGVLMHGTLVVGMPGESEEEIKRGFEFVEALPFHSMNVFIAQAIPGSELFERQISTGDITYEQALHIDTAHSTLHLTHIPAPRLEGLVEDLLERYNGTFANKTQSRGTGSTPNTRTGSRKSVSASPHRIPRRLFSHTTKNPSRLLAADD